MLEVLGQMQPSLVTVGLTKRRGRFLAGALVSAVASMTMVGLAAVPSSAASFPPIETQVYTVAGASSAVTNLTASVWPNTTPAIGNYTVRFTTPSALFATSTKGSTTTFIDIEDSAGSGNGIVSTATAAGVGVADISTGYIFSATVGNGFLTAASATTPLIIYLGGSGKVNAGDTLLLTFAATNPAAGSYTFSLQTSANPAYASTTTPVAIVSSSAPAAAFTSTPALGKGAVYTLSNLPAGATTSSVTIQACAGSSPPAAPCTPGATANGGTGGIFFSQVASSYTVVDTTRSTTIAVATALPVKNSGNYIGGVTLTLSSPAASGDKLSVTATGINPNSPETDYFGVSFGGLGNGFATAGPVGFGETVLGVTVGVSNNAALATATYTIGYTVSSTGAMPSGGTVTIEAPGGTNFSSNSGAVIIDSTSGGTQAVSTAGLTLSSTKSTDDTLALPTSLALSGGDSVTVTIFNVTNPAGGTFSGSTGLSVTTTGDPLAAYNAVAYTISSSTLSSGATAVTVSPATPGALSSYTIGTFKAASALVAGVDTIEVKVAGAMPSGTELPGTATLSDSTTSAGSQTLTARSGAGTDDVVYNLSASVAAGDILSLTMATVVNPAGGNYKLELGADTVVSNSTTAGTEGLVTPEPNFPDANATYPNGALVNFGGAIYVFAGGHAFGVPSPTALAALQKVDKAVVQPAAPGASVPSGPPRAGTLVTTGPVNANWAIWVVGNDGQLHGFASPKQLFADGYDPALTVTVPTLGGITQGPTAGREGAAISALATSADGAIVATSGTYYVFAGGRAFGIPNLVKLAALRATDTATPLTGTLSANQVDAPVADGAILTVVGGGVYVTSGGNLFPFKSINQLVLDGYSGTPAVPVPSTGGLIVEFPYAGS
jgi:hypothetical protein